MVPGLACLLLMVLLMWVLLPGSSAPPRRRPASGWCARRRARTPHRPASGASPRDTPDAATLLDLTAAMLRAGVGIEPAVHRLSEDVPGCPPLGRVHRRLVAGQPWRQAWSCVDSQPQLREFGEELAFAHATGAPTAELLELTAVQARRRRRAAVEEKAARLSVQMVLPLGVCFLPGFILLGVVPVVLGLFQELA